MTETRRTARQKRSAALGLVAVALFSGLVFLTGRFLKGGFQGGEAVEAVFSAPGVGQQLPIGGDVKVRGVLVGRIQDITLDDDGKAVIHMQLNGAEDIPAESRAEIRSKTVFGQKWVELIPPADAAGPSLQAGDVIPDERTKEPLEFEQALQLGHDLLSEIPLGDLAVVLRNLSEGFGGNERDARKALDRGLVALKAVNSRSAEFDLSLRQLREFSEWLDDNDTDLLSFLSGLDDANRALVGAAPEFRSNLTSVPAFFDRLASFQELIESDLGRLVEEGATVAEIVAARSDRLTDIIVELEPFTTVWNSGLSQPCGGEFESNMICWQVFQMPGLDSRGLYGPGEAPDANEPGDPLFGVVGESPLGNSALQTLITDAFSDGVDGVEQILLVPVAGESP
ncbi:MAG: phospholipid/cholesterol/gamma-HCH transport system substrate-binding protein [Actinomycetota bacterium]|nr:phospholipid/cholesterol/gamma-HCH transport system substrate-binding protein [Actinomycetota bacterium]